ncbi:abc transporter atp-binding protein [Lasius niger]|uniref:Abc transporter atp-binding protein n=1 Tax=Lasius niger TaxID=67767 RepID=A0A0J7KNN2_LASNI|nr:abc transporter atp-binding protein [Lasius niger]
MKAPKYLLGALQEALSYNANAFMIYTGAPQNANRKPIKDLFLSEFKQQLTSNGIKIENVVVHAPYIINLANTIKPSTFDFSVELLQKELKRCQEIGVKTMVLHPGSTVGAEKNLALKKIIQGLDQACFENQTVKIALETMAGGTFDPIHNQHIKIAKTAYHKLKLDESYLKHIGYIEQNPQILYGDFIENIRYTKQNATFGEIQIATEKANLDGYIRELPDNYETILGERGMNLSGGQKQRVAIARVFLKNPQLLILDEATSALDNIVEKEIQTQFNKLMVGRTSIVIAHRLSTIKNVDEILVLEKNTGLVQTGTFDQLKIQDGHFKNLYQAGLMD